jgi:hypothetical protein
VDDAARGLPVGAYRADHDLTAGRGDDPRRRPRDGQTGDRAAVRQGHAGRALVDAVDGEGHAVAGGHHRAGGVRRDPEIHREPRPARLGQPQRRLELPGVAPHEQLVDPGRGDPARAQRPQGEQRRVEGRLGPARAARQPVADDPELAPVAGRDHDVVARRAERDEPDPEAVGVVQGQRRGSRRRRDEPQIAIAPHPPRLVVQPAAVGGQPRGLGRALGGDLVLHHRRRPRRVDAHHPPRPLRGEAKLREGDQPVELREGVVG